MSILKINFSIEFPMLQNPQIREVVWAESKFWSFLKYFLPFFALSSLKFGQHKNFTTTREHIMWPKIFKPKFPFGLISSRCGQIFFPLRFGFAFNFFKI